MARIKCPRCKRPLRSCYCQNLKPEPASVDLLIIQHPSETRHAINTARIADLGISNCDILVGEDFTGQNTLNQKLSDKKACLLFPSQNDSTTRQYVAEHGKPELCVILDGTWRKAKKIYYLNPVLQQLPAVVLTDIQPSDYKIRKAPGAEALSTIEASVAFLREVGQNNVVHQNCLDAFHTMIDLQIAAMGEEIFNRNYSKRR